MALDDERRGRFSGLLSATVNFLALYASWTPNIQVVEELLRDGGSPIDAVDNWGRTALINWVFDGRPVASVKALLDWGADPTLPDHINAATALSYAYQFEREEYAALLEVRGRGEGVDGDRACGRGLRG